MLRCFYLRNWNQRACNPTAYQGLLSDRLPQDQVGSLELGTYFSIPKHPAQPKRNPY
jgi:hypothetical protein